MRLGLLRVNLSVFPPVALFLASYLFPSAFPIRRHTETLRHKQIPFSLPCVSLLSALPVINLYPPLTLIFSNHIPPSDIHRGFYNNFRSILRLGR